MPATNQIAEMRRPAPDIRVFFPVYCCGAFVSHGAISLCEELRKLGANVDMLAPAVRQSAMRPFMRRAMPELASRLLYRLGRERNLVKFAEVRYVGNLKNDDVCWCWPDTPAKTLRRVRGKDRLVVLERLNCHVVLAKPRLDEAYAALGIAPQHGINASTIDREDELISEATHVFSPSPMVTQSLIEAGVPNAKILETSNGWSPERINQKRVVPPKPPGLNVLFMGRVCVRKGAHLLLRAWAASGVKGRLTLVGNIEPVIRERCAAWLNRDDVSAVGRVTDVVPRYRSADVFALPSVEEGDPLVTHEAMACGLPCVLSPMGAGAVARHGIDALVHDPFDTDWWIDTFQRLSRSPDERQSIGRAAELRARFFTWEEVARRRYGLLQSIVHRANPTRYSTISADRQLSVDGLQAQPVLSR